MLRQLKAHLTDQQSRASFASLAVVATGAVLAFLMFTFIARTIGPNEFGRFATWFNIASFLAVVGALGQETFIGRSWNEYAGAERWDLAQGAVRFGALNVQIGAGCALLLFLAIGLIMHAEPALLLAGGLVVISHPLFVFLYQFTRAVVGHLKSDALYECVWRLVVILGLFGLSVSGLPMTTTGVLALVGFGYLSVSLCLLVLVRHQTPPAAWLATPKAETAVWRQRSVKFWLAALLEASGQYLDVVVVHLLLGEIAAGAYFAATRIANIFAKISQAFETRAASKLSYYYYRGDHAALGELLLGLSRTTLLVVAVGLPGMLVLGKLLLPVFAEIYAKEFPALAVLTIGTALVTLTGSARLVLLHTGHEGA
jgi:O-antigen/teichoic acid export membrane protein